MASTVLANYSLQFPPATDLMKLSEVYTGTKMIGETLFPVWLSAINLCEFDPMHIQLVESVK